MSRWALPHAAPTLSLLGDPTLKQDVVPAVGGLQVKTQQLAGLESLTSTLSWTAVSGAKGYFVYRASSPDGPFEKLNASAQVSTQFTDFDVSPSARSYYMVRALKDIVGPSGTVEALSMGVVRRAGLVTGSVFEWQYKPQGIKLALAESVNALAAADVDIYARLYDSTSSTLLPETLMPSSQYEIGTHNASEGTVSIKLKLTTLNEASIGGVFSTGRYRIALRVRQTRPEGSLLVATHEQQFLFALGDSNNDGAVNFNDLTTLAQHYNQTSASSFGEGDSDGDGDVDFDDLVRLAQRYNFVLPT